MNTSSRDVTQGIKGLTRLVICSKMWKVSVNMRKDFSHERGKGRDKNRSTVHTRGSCRRSQSVDLQGRRHAARSESGEPERDQSRGTVASKASRLSSLSQFPEQSESQDKINLRPALGRPQISQNFDSEFIVAVGLFLADCNPQRIAPGIMLPKLSITRLAKSVKLYKSWVCIRKCAYSWL